MASKDDQAAEAAETLPMGLIRPSVKKWLKGRPGQGCGPQSWRHSSPVWVHLEQ